MHPIPAKDTHRTVAETPHNLNSSRVLAMRIEGEEVAALEIEIR